MKKILLVDTNYAAAPIHDYLEKTGNLVFVCGGNPDDFLAKTAKNYINLDYSDTNALLSLTRELDIDYVVPGCNDRSYQACAEVNAQKPYYGIDSVSTTQAINNKKKFRELSEEIGIPVPQVFEKVGQIQSWPVIVKPVDAYSGRGISIVNSEKEIPEAKLLAERFSHTKQYIAEEFITGQLYSHSAFIKKQKITTDFIVMEHGSANPFVVDTSHVVQNPSSDLILSMRSHIETLAMKLKMVDGLVHTQFILSKDEIKFIEVTRRCPGDLYSQLIELSTGFPYAEEYAKHFINLKRHSPTATEKKSHILRHTVSQPQDGLFQSIAFNTPLKIEKLIPLCSAGTHIKASPFGRIALLFIEAESKDELTTLSKSLLERKLYRIH